MSEIKLHPSWREKLKSEFEKPYMKDLKAFLKKELDQGKKIYPQAPKIFEALNLTPFEKVKVVILGQDPYHGVGQAHGLAFSVLPDITPPPSLKNIYKEINKDLGLPIPENGYLKPWAEEGVFLLNSCLTVEARRPASHKGKGWEIFTDKVIEILNEEKEDLVFLLWGSFAKEKGSRIDPSRHCILTAPHPSPFSADRGFFNCKHFSKANEYLKSKNISPINWSKPS